VTFAKANALLWAPTLAAAATVAAVPGLAQATREAFSFKLEPHPGSFSEASEIFATNLRVAATLLLAAVVVAAAPLARPLMDALLVAIILPNTLLVGAALGAYQSPRWLVHLPLEWAALALALGPYGRPPSRPDATPLPLAAVRTVLALSAAASFESFLTP
jgi:hypothetical protein